MKRGKGTEKMSIIRRARVPFAAIALAAGLLAGPLTSHFADASLGVCRGDPVVMLNNGIMIQIVATIQDDQHDVQSVTYVLHAPVGTSVKDVWYGGGYLKHVESFRFYADDTPNTYDTDTVASTGTSGVAVAATTAVVDLSGLKGMTTTTGVSGSDLLAHVAF